MDREDAVSQSGGSGDTTQIAWRMPYNPNAKGSGHQSRSMVRTTTMTVVITPNPLLMRLAVD